MSLSEPQEVISASSITAANVMRQFISKNDLDKDGLLEISGKDFRYFRQVLRLKSGDMVLVRLPDGNLVNMTLCRADDSAKKITLQVCDLVHRSEFADNRCQTHLVSESSFDDFGKLNHLDAQTEFYLFMFVPKSSKFDLIVRQATECGISKIFPVSSDFSQKGAEKMNFRGERFGRIIKEARQQSGSSVPTEVEDCIDVQKLCGIWQDEIQKSKLNGYEVFGCVLYERSEFTQDLTSAIQTLDSSKKIRKCALVVGSEGGISPDEIKKLLGAGFFAIHFETNILRCETAALYGTAILQNAAFERENHLAAEKNLERKNETN